MFFVWFYILFDGYDALYCNNSGDPVIKIYFPYFGFKIAELPCCCVGPEKGMFRKGNNHQSSIQRYMMTDKPIDTKMSFGS